jgi:glycosyltransferase involved in cell wall biosynthesis|tara:strand:+ start:227 stop:1165 length:939 start_codon:yes stop_codon:yes gene_type:complete
MKILYFGNTYPSAIGIINLDIKAVIDRKYHDIQFDILSHGIRGDAELFYIQRVWKNYDLLIVDPCIVQAIEEMGWHLAPEDVLEFKRKLISVYHHELDVPSQHFRHGTGSGWYENWFTTPVCGINPYIVNQIKERGVDSQMLPIGVNMDKFKPYKKVKKIKRAGFVGNAHQDSNEDWNYIKRPDIFKEICKKAGIEPVIIAGREHGPEMYEDVDIVICPSMAEGLPTYFAEVAACKIPFISTNVGIVREYSKVKTFKTTDQAVKIINNLNESEDNIKEYVNDLYGEMFPDRNWENILEVYWIPYFNKLLNIK